MLGAGHLKEPVYHYSLFSAVHQTFAPDSLINQESFDSQPALLYL